MDVLLGGTFLIIVASTCLPMLLVGGILYFIAQRGMRSAKITQTWPTTNGQIMFSTVQARTTSSSEGTSTSHYPVVTYQYQVGGQMYQSNSLYAGSEVGYWRGKAERKAAQYPQGAMVPVYFNPMNPSQSVLETTAPGSKLMMWIVIVLAVITVITLAFIAVIYMMTGSVT